MPKKVHIKKKRHKEACRSQVGHGLINSASGDFVPYNKSGAEQAAIKSVVEGYGFRYD